METIPSTDGWKDFYTTDIKAKGNSTFLKGLTIEP
jgi:hypothetical protein